MGESLIRYFAYLTIGATVLLLLSDSTYQPQRVASDPDERRETTMAVISGRVTPDGRPILWKNRDRRAVPDQEVGYFTDGDYPYTTLINAGDDDEAWGGANTAGFAIVNSNSYNLTDTVPGDDDDGFVIKCALQTCATVEDFVHLLDSTNLTGRTAPCNYGVMDAAGNVALFEVSAGSYVGFDANDSSDAPDGFLARANFSVTGGDTQRWSQWRYDRATALLHAASQDSAITPSFLFKTISRDVALEDLDPYPLPLEEAYGGRNWPPGFIPTNEVINRYITRASLILQGLVPDEDPLLTTFYAGIGQPLAAVPVPLWVRAGSVPEELNGEPTALLSDLALRALGIIYNPFLAEDALNTWQLSDSAGNGLLDITDPVVDTIMARTELALAQWRQELPAPEEITRFQNAQGRYAGRRLSEWRGVTLRRVPDDYETIQEAIDMSSPGDTVLVMPGVYPSPVEFRGRNIILGSLFLTTGDQRYIDSTIIDGARNGRSLVVIRNRENRNARLTGFTLRNAFTNFGGAVYANGSAPTLDHLLIVNNEVEFSGAGILATAGARLRLDHAIILNNRATNMTGAIYFRDSSNVTVTNSIIRENVPAGLQAGQPVSYCNVQGDFDGEGIIDEDPLFVEPDSGNYRLSEDSPCLDAGDPQSPKDPDGTVTDMGVFYLYQKDIEVEPLALVFDAIMPDSQDSRELVIRNVGLTALELYYPDIFTLAGEEAPFWIDWIWEGNCEIAPESEVTLTVYFAPEEGGDFTSLLYIYSDDPDEDTVLVYLKASAIISGAGSGEPLPVEFAITEVYPNPFNARLTLTYALPRAGDVSLTIYDLAGRKISSYLTDNQPSGVHTMTLDASGWAAGIYIAKLEYGGMSVVRKVVCIK